MNTGQNCRCLHILVTRSFQCEVERARLLPYSAHRRGAKRPLSSPCRAHALVHVPVNERQSVEALELPAALLQQRHALLGVSLRSVRWLWGCVSTHPLTSVVWTGGAFPADWPQPVCLLSCLCEWVRPLQQWRCLGKVVGSPLTGEVGQPTGLDSSQITHRIHER